jgi:hypothetical protein
MGIRERAEILGGVARVESSPGQGTHVEVRIPVPREAPPASAAGEGRDEGERMPGDASMPLKERA